MNFGGFFSLKVSSKGVEVLFLLFIHIVVFCVSERLYSFLN